MCRYLDIEEPRVAVGVDMIVENDQLVIVAAAWQIPTPRHKAWGSKSSSKGQDNVHEHYTQTTVETASSSGRFSRVFTGVTGVDAQGFIVCYSHLQTMLVTAA